MTAIASYFARFLLALDILANTILGGDVETMSSRMGREIREGKRCAVCTGVCWLLSRFWPGHCVNNIMDPVNKHEPR
jgi:hypothetical protein